MCVCVRAHMHVCVLWACGGACVCACLCVGVFSSTLPSSVPLFHFTNKKTGARGSKAELVSDMAWNYMQKPRLHTPPTLLLMDLFFPLHEACLERQWEPSKASPEAGSTGRGGLLRPGPPWQRRKACAEAAHGPSRPPPRGRSRRVQRRTPNNWLSNPNDRNSS